MNRERIAHILCRFARFLFQKRIREARFCTDCKHEVLDEAQLDRETGFDGDVYHRTCQELTELVEVEELILFGRCITHAPCTKVVN